MGYPEDLTDIKGIGIASAQKIAERYSSKEELIESLRSDTFDVSDRLEEILRDEFSSLLVVDDEEPGSDEEEADAPEAEAPVRKKAAKVRPRIRSTLRQPVQVHYGDRFYVVPNRFTKVPEEHEGLFDSLHFRDLCLHGWIVVEANHDA